MSSVRILYVSPYVSAVATSATELRTMHIAKALQSVGSVEVISIAADENAAAANDFVAPATTRADEIGVETTPNRGWIQKAKWLLNAQQPYPHGMAVEQQGVGRVRRAARECDLIWFYKLRTANMFPQWAWPRSVVDVDDIPSLIERSELSSDMSLSAKVATLLRMKSWQRRERLLGERFSVLTVCSKADRTYLTRLGVSAPMHVVANGYERPATTPVRQLASPPRLGFIGVFDHAPNAEGVHWFVRHCWPHVKREVPDARLRLVGRLTDGPLSPSGQDIDALGYLPDPNSEMATWSAMIVPVHTGAGTRGKIAHAFSQKCPVVSTPLGAYGYDPTDGQDMLLGQSPEQFADACVRAIQRPQTAADMAERAWLRFVDEWSWDAISSQVCAAARECLRREVA
jgi:hypothetical protein